MSTLKTGLPRFAGAAAFGAGWSGLLRAAALRMTAWTAVRPADPADDAAAVRELAFRHMKCDPGYAADLFAAADRHEAQAAGRRSPDPVRPQPAAPDRGAA